MLNLEDMNGSRAVIAAVVIALLTHLSSEAREGDKTYSFLRLDHSARAAALGGSFVSMTDDAAILFYNPAGLGTLTSRQVSFGYLKHVLDINAGHVAYGQEFRDWGWIGAGVIYINYGSFTQTDVVGNKLGTFRANELAGLLGYSGTLYQKLHYGVTLKLVYSSIADARSLAIAGDVGMLYDIPSQQIAIGASLLNLGRQVNAYQTTREDLPLELKVGVSKRLEHLPLLLNLNFHRLNESTEDFATRFRAFSVGGEFTVTQAVQLRFGYNNEQRRDLKIGTSAGLAGLSFGGGFTSGRYRFDYAYSSLGKIGELHRISLGVLF